MIETVPSTAGSTPYFNPSTQRFHDPVTKRMVKTPRGPQSVMDPGAMKPMQGPTAPDAQTGLVLNSLNSMKDSLKELVSLTKKSLGIEEKEFAADQFTSAKEGLAGADLDAGTDPPPDDKGKGGFLEGIKGAFGKLRAPSLGAKGKLLLLAAGLWGLTTFSETIVKTLAPMLEWLDKTITSMKKTYKEEGFAGLKDQFMELVVKPSLAPLGLTWTKEGGIDRIKGSWLDVLDPFTGPTNIFRTLKYLWMGKNPDTEEYFVPVWMRPPEEWEWYNKWKESKKEAGFEEDDYFYNIWSLWNGKNPVTGESFLPEWMTTPINEMGWYKDVLGEDFLNTLKGDPKGTLKSLWEGKNPETGESFLPEWMNTPINEMDWYKDTVEYVKTLANDPKGTLKSLWEGKNPVTGESFLPEWMTKPINEMQWFKDTVKFYDDIVASDYGQMLNLPTSEEMSTAIRSVTDMIYNPKTGEVFGMNLNDMKNLLPKLQDIVDKIISSLPKWMRPNTVFEQIADTQGDIIDKKAQIAKEKKDIAENTLSSVGWSNKDNIIKLERLEKELLELENKEKSLKEQVFGYSEPTSNLTMLDNQHMRVKTDNLNLAAQDKDTRFGGNLESANMAVVNQGDTIVGKQENILVEKGVNHQDVTPFLTFNEGAFLANGGKINN